MTKISVTATRLTTSAQPHAGFELSVRCTPSITAAMIASSAIARADQMKRFWFFAASRVARR